MSAHGQAVPFAADPSIRVCNHCHPGEQVVVTHVLHLSGRATNFERYPPHKSAHTLPTVSWCRNQAKQIGPGVVAVIDKLSQVNAVHRLRSIQGIVGLRDRYADARLDAACARAL